ncbi:MAG: methionine--tRNA ligase [Candidatus Wildermuthbacteria bacterium]|nr:methionine--tRNA ligase [Candidatus Wildermuthbacteria bacterium]
MEKFYITTSIPYVNGPPHIGFALEIIQADVLARFNRRKGSAVFFLTGTDEHGLKIAKSAKDAGVSPREFTDSISGKFRDLAKKLDISNDDFIRTTDAIRHWPAVQTVWKQLKEHSDLEKRSYEGLYCAGCEAFMAEKDLAEGLCPIHKKAPEPVKEENWFFLLSKYGPALKEKLESGELRIVPESRKNEILELIKQGLQDVSFSRPKEKLQWGIPVPDDDTQVVYVWADALTNYISALGYPSGEKFKEYWPASVHAVGKDILRFHATIWPAMLLSLGLPLPKIIFVHGFITVEGQKMSKSLGNVIDPFSLIEKYGADAVRYFFLREVPAAEDGDFSFERFEQRYNADLASGLGNLVARVLKMGDMAFGETLPVPAGFSDKQFQSVADEARKGIDGALDNFQFGSALEKIWEVMRFCDKYIDEKKPWEQKDGSREVIGDLLFAIHELADFLEPFLPGAARKITIQLAGRDRAALFPRAV